MKGMLKERSPGHWAIILEVRDPATGKRKRKWHSFTGGKREAENERNRLCAAITGGTYLDPSKLTVAAFLEKWLAHVAPLVSPRTHERYAEIVSKNLAPRLGGIKLTKLQPIHISEALSKMLTSERRKGRGGLSPNTVRHIRVILSQALNQAVKWNLLHRNPVHAVEPPKKDAKPARVMDAASAADLIEAARSSEHFMAILLATMAGIRRGEICALRWRSVDLDNGEMAVVASTSQLNKGNIIEEKDTKSSRSRTVALPSLLVDELRRHRLAQAEQLLRLGIRQDRDHHVIMDAAATAIKPNSLTKAIKRFTREHGFQIGLHGLRHSHASFMLASNVHPKIVQERLGHASISVTMDTYSHLMPNMQKEAAGSVDAVMRTALQNRRRTD